VQLLRTYSTDRETDLNTFIDALGFNWLIAGTDAHAKNYSLLLAGHRIRLAALYDVARLASCHTTALICQRSSSS
jgi:serine/threonine-protein kinase HipA